MARKALEMTIEIGGKVAGSLGNAFQRATGNIDDLRNQSRSAQRELNRLGNEFRQGRITQSQYAQETERVTRELRQLENAQRRIKAISGTLQSGINTAKATAGIATVTATTVAAGMAMKSIDIAGQFEYQMAAVGAKAQSTSKEMKEMKATALELGATTSLSAIQVAKSMDELAAGGFDATKIIQAMPGIIAGAEASGEDLSLVAGTVSTALSVWGMEAAEAAHVSDVLAMAANISSAGVGDLAQAFKYAGKPAAILGLSLEEVAAATAIMTNEGLDGSNAGTSLRASLLSLNNPARAQQKIMSRLGFSMRDSKGEAKSLSTIVKDLADSTKDMTDAERVATIGKLVGTEAVSGFLTLVSAGPATIDKMTRSLEQSGGSAAKAAAKMKDNYAGAKQQFKGMFESAQIAFATPILPVLQKAMLGATGMVADNMEQIEALGERVAGSLETVLEPFATTKPELTPEIRYDPEAFKKYEKELAKFTKFDGMDFGDKVIYSLDTATGKMEAWLSGSGGEAMSDIFSKLGEIAFNVWLGAFTGALKATGSNAMEGNVGGAIGMGAAAWMMGGGLMVKGAIGAGKWGKDVYDSRRATTQPPPPPSPPIPPNPPNPGSNGGIIGPSRTGTITRYGGGPTPPPVPPPVPPVPPNPPPPSRGANMLNSASKFASKAMLPVGLAMEGYNIYKSDDKAKATSEAAAGFAGGAGGAKLGAVIGTAIAPGIGTAIGGVLGGVAGFIGGKWAGGKAVDTVRGNSATATSAPAPVSAPANSAVATPAPPFDATQLNTSATALATTLTVTNTSLTALNTQFTLTQTTITTSFTNLQTNTDLVTNNMQILASYTGQASGWIVGGLSGIQAAGQRVVTALNNLETRINNVQLPGGATTRRTQYE